MESELVEWIEEACGIKSGVKEIVDALQALGVETRADLRFITEARMDGLTGWPRTMLLRLMQFVPDSDSHPAVTSSVGQTSLFRHSGYPAREAKRVPSSPRPTGALRYVMVRRASR